VTGHEPQPLPPDDLASRNPELLKVVAGEKMHRVYPREFGPTYFDKSKGSRFNAPDGSYGVMYTSANVEGAFVETVLRGRRDVMIDTGYIRTRGMAALRATEELTFVLLAGPSLSRLGCDADVCHRAAPYDAPQAWSKALHETFPDVHGIAYRSRHDDNEICYAVFERAKHLVEEVERTEPVDRHSDFWTLVDKYELELAA